MRVTQLDIAKYAKVSQATVSRVLSGDDRVEPAIRGRVLDVIRLHNYQPDVRARSLRLRRTGLIGLVLKRPQGGLSDDPFFAALTAGIMDFLCGKPYHLCVDVVTDDASQEGIYDEMLRTRRVDGLILVEPEASDERISLLQRDKFPFVLIGNPKNDSIYSVDNDNVHAGELATRHLIECGYRRIAFLGGPEHITVSDDRIQGYRRAVEAEQLEPIIRHSKFGFEPARYSAVDLLATKRPDAIVVLDDFMACGVVLAARQLNYRVPEQLGLVAFNDTSLCNLLDVGLTSVSLGIERIVQAAVCMLLQVIEDGEVSVGDIRQIVPCELMVRGSSRPAEVVSR
jgi:DNA-binding LacI/PurR family transcriptional regulator